MMTHTDQSEVIDFLCRTESHGGRVDRIEKIETHISVVFLAGARVFKLKRAVHYPYVDFSTPDLRRHYCEAEVTVNRRTAPDLYKGVVAVTRSKSGGLELAGDGDPVDWLVEMARFDQDTLFDRLAQGGKLNRALMRDLAEEIARFHTLAEQRPGTDYRDALARTVASDAAAFTEFGKGVFDDDMVKNLIDAENMAIRSHCGARASAREIDGYVRHCHGDLHLRNIFLHKGRPTLFDAIEFNPLFSNIDVLYDLAFLLMDLDHRGMRRYGNCVLNCYLDITGDTAGLGCLPLYLSMRAAIRAHVAAAAAAATDDAAEAEGKRGEARAYLTQATDYLNPPPSKLIAIGGLSGSGKSRLSRELAHYLGASPGARIARSDVLRKRLAGVAPASRLGLQGYTGEMTAQTYRALYHEARTALLAGQSVVADAVFAAPEERRAIAALAAELDVPFRGIWLEAPAPVMIERVTARTGDASDADADVVARQLTYELGDIDWPRLDSSGSREQTLAGGLAIADPQGQRQAFNIASTGR